MKLRGSLFGRELELRVRLFHLLALAGILVSICVGVGALFTDVWVAVAGCFTLCAFAVGLLVYSIRTGRYQRCYLLTVIVIFMAGFSVMFFVGGGYLGGMPLFFIFAVVFTAFLIEGRELAVLIALELCIYSADILLAYFFPQFVIWHASMTDIAIDFVVCTIVVALSLSASTVLEVSQYRLQQRELERARREAVEAVKSGQYHVILLDYMMPEMDGVETLRALPGFATPVVALTADAVAGTERMLLDAGFSAYAAKPVTGERLERLLLDCLPPELVTAVELERTDAAETAERAQRLAGQLRPYGLELHKALEYFGGDLSQCGATAALFLRHDSGERRRVEELWSGGDCAALRYPVHALKSKAKNMGADRLCAVCAQVEALCEAGDAPQAESLLPHLCYLWGRAREGLRLLTDALGETTEEKPPLSREDCLRELPGLLQSLRRQPSLDRLEALLAAEPPGARRALEQAREAVLGFDFEAAERLFAAYVDAARGGRADGTAE